MSTHRCNFCTYQDFSRLASTRHHILTVRPAPFPQARLYSGVDIYIHPPDYTPPLRRLCHTLPHRSPVGEWWVAWFASLPAHCCC